MRKNEQLIGAAAERKAILRKLRITKRGMMFWDDCLDYLIAWMLNRCERYDKCAGGLGRKRKGV